MEVLMRASTRGQPAAQSYWDPATTGGKTGIGEGIVVVDVVGVCGVGVV